MQDSNFVARRPLKSVPQQLAAQWAGPACGGKSRRRPTAQSASQRTGMTSRLVEAADEAGDATAAFADRVGMSRSEQT